jgi:hypothetical protein
MLLGSDVYLNGYHHPILSAAGDCWLTGTSPKAAFMRHIYDGIVNLTSLLFGG